jgi:tRNA threonylcarbamoyladenosine biosynthesis protein TsaB
LKVEGLILGLDCSGETYSVALWDELLLGERSGGTPRRHLVELFPALHELCQECGRGLDQVRGVGVTAGPGSFTGLRTGLLIAKTLGQALGIATVPLDTLDVLAANIVDAENVVAAVDARKGEVVWARYTVRNGRPQPLEPRNLAAPEVWLEALTPGATVVGSACKTYAALLQTRPDVKVSPEASWVPSAAVIARLAGRSPGVAWDKLRPEYVRPADVQVHTS